MYITEQYINEQIITESLLLEGPIDYIKSKFGSNLTKLNVWKKSVSVRLKKHKINEMKAQARLKKIASKHIIKMGKALLKGFKTRNYKSVSKQMNISWMAGYNYIKDYVFSINWKMFPLKVTQGLMSVLIMSLCIFFLETILSGAAAWYIKSISINILGGPSGVIMKTVLNGLTWATYYIISLIISMIFVPVIKETSRALAVAGEYTAGFTAAVTVVDVFRSVFYYWTLGFNKLTKSKHILLFIGSVIVNVTQSVLMFVGSLPGIRNLLGPWVFLISVGITNLWENMIVPTMSAGAKGVGVTPGMKVLAAKNDIKASLEKGTAVVDKAMDKTGEWLSKVLSLVGIKTEKLPSFPKLPNPLEWGPVKKFFNTMYKIGSRNLNRPVIADKGFKKILITALDDPVGELKKDLKYVADKTQPKMPYSSPVDYSYAIKQLKNMGSVAAKYIGKLIPMSQAVKTMDGMK